MRNHSTSRTLLATLVFSALCSIAQAAQPAKDGDWWQLPEGRFSGSLDNLNRPQGRGVLTTKAGAHYEGGFLNGRFEGQGVYDWKGANPFHYEGQFSNGVYKGQGTLTMATGETYTGAWVGGAREGKGTYRWANGNVYTGDFVRNVLHGSGVMVYANGSRYEGQWKEDEHNGQGRFQWKDGTVYEGQFLSSRFHGQGVRQASNGTVESGRWENGTLIEGEIKYASGDVWRGFATGPCEKHWSSGGDFKGVCREGRFDSGELIDGRIRWVGQWKDGRLVEGYRSSPTNFALLPPDGYGTCVFNGQDEECQYRNGERIDSKYVARVAQTRRPSSAAATPADPVAPKAPSVSR